ncbi:MAG: hypothetical protein AB2L14_05165 [Candidatus Xenobiia bacterium LiM19]
MNYMQIITAVAALLAGLWTLTQLVAYVREKDPKNLNIALVLLIVIVGLIIAYPHLKERVVPMALKTVSGQTGVTRASPPLQDQPSENPTGLSSSVNVPAVGEATAPSALPPSIQQPSDQPSSAQPSSAPSQGVPAGSEISSSPPLPPAPTSAGTGRGDVKSSFLIDIRRNMLGGINDIIAKCTFAEVGNSDVEMISYAVSVHYLESPDDPVEKAVTRSFDRTLKDRIAVKANTTVQKELTLDREIGDLVIKSRKSRSIGWITIAWIGKDSAGNEISSRSTSNRPDDAAQ